MEIQDLFLLGMKRGIPELLDIEPPGFNLGAGRAQIRGMVMIESAMLGIVGQIFGVLAGFALALILIYVINVQSFGWTIQFHVPLSFLVQASALLLVVTTLAGAYPGRLFTAPDVLSIRYLAPLQNTAMICLGFFLKNS